MAQGTREAVPCRDDLGQIRSLCFSAKGFLWDEPTSASLSPNSTLENVRMLNFLVLSAPSNSS